MPYRTYHSIQDIPVSFRQHQEWSTRSKWALILVASLALWALGVFGVWGLATVMSTVLK